MAELTSTKLNAESHLLLEQPILRLPCELSRKNFKTVQKHVEHARDVILSSLKATANASLDGTRDPSQTLHSLDVMISSMQGLKRKMERLHEEEKVLHQHSRKRIQHLNDLYHIPSLADVKYDEWSKIRLDRLLVDYLLRSGYGESAKALARDKKIEELVDLDIFVQCQRVEESLRNGSTAEALAWCLEHKPLMKRTNENNLEFQLRLQQYVELCRSRNMVEATQHAKKYIVPHQATHLSDCLKGSGLLAHPPTTQTEPYKTMYHHLRWHDLASLFLKTHHDLFSLPARPLLHVALSAGLSALKTPSCHSAYNTTTNTTNTTILAHSASSAASACPICSTELNELARHLPYALHTKSIVEDDPVVLPNGRIHGLAKLVRVTAKAGLRKGHVKDPTTGAVFGEDTLRKVYIS